jgi:LysR family transcriptional regulator of gallate degradation
VNLRHLQAFSVVAATGSVTQAAEALFRVPSAVTRAVGELEQCVGHLLFERKARGMLLNAYGTATGVRVARIELEFKAACQELAAVPGARKLDTWGLLTAMFNGRRLAMFSALAEMRNMPSVAAQYGVTQSALSALVRELEARTGCTLFTRSARGVSPTPAGEQIAFRCSRALAELRSIGSDLAAIVGVVQGNVVVGIGPLPLSRTTVLPTAIVALIEKHPSVRVRTLERPYELLLAAVRSGEVDVILGAMRATDEVKGLVQEHLFDNRIVVVARAGHPLARAAKVSFQTLQQAQWVLSQRQSPTRELLESFFAEHDESMPQPVVETGDLALVRGLLLRSDMLACVSAHQLQYELEAGTLVIIDFQVKTTLRKIGIIQRSSALPAPCTLALLDEVRAAAKAANIPA